ncbi:50S ribosomal protein L23 [Candidatus Microgenomates bacterium]|nr:50S ribosomal protein L23 [Candidatus Microgenomates bacterium]
MILGAVLTEKTMAEAKKGKFTFWVTRNMDKLEIKKAIKSLFDVDILSVKTINLKSESKKTVRGKITTKLRKKAIVQVKEGQKIALFEEPKKGKQK